MRTETTLNAPGAMPALINREARNAHIERVWREGLTGEDKTPIVLEPTPAQIASGRRVLWLSHSSSSSVEGLMAKAASHGWDAGMSRSRYLSAYVISGRNKGRRVEHEVHCVRLRHRGRMLIGHASWEIEVDGGGWKFESASLARYVEINDMILVSPPVALGATALTEVVMGGGFA